MNGPALANGFEGQHGLLVGAALRLPLKRLCYRRRRCSPWLCAPRQGCCRSERSLYLTRRRHSPRLASPVTAPVMMMLSPLLVAPFVSIAPLVPMSIAAITGIVGPIAPVVVISGAAVQSGPVIAVMSAPGSEEQPSELQQLLRHSYAVFRLKQHNNLHLN